MGSVSRLVGGGRRSNPRRVVPAVVDLPLKFSEQFDAVWRASIALLEGSTVRAGRTLARNNEVLHLRADGSLGVLEECPDAFETARVFVMESLLSPQLDDCEAA